MAALEDGKAWADVPVRFCSVPWAKDCAPDDWRDRLNRINTKMSQWRQGDPPSAEFYRAQLAKMLLDVNRMEGTVSPKLPEGEALSAILKFLNDSCEEPAVVAWNAEGARTGDTVSSSDRQLYQMARAAVHLFRENAHAPLSLELIQSTYRRMMEHAYQEDKRGNRTALPVDDFRTSPVYAGLYMFAPAAAAKNAVIALCHDYNDGQARAMHPVGRATYLFYELITIHPFGNGNGRLCRLFLAWSLLRDDCLLPVSFSSGHKKRRQHYLHAINRARLEPFNNRGELNAILVVSLERTLRDYDSIEE
eukprot:gene8535-6152_t